MRAMMDCRTEFDRRKLVPLIRSGDAILSRQPFIAAAKAVLAGVFEDGEWRRVLPPMAEIPLIEQKRLVADFIDWDAHLPPDYRSFAAPESASSKKVVSLRFG
jgi:4-hydroxy-tetrahydrodipicolinate synthase